MKFEDRSEENQFVLLFLLVPSFYPIDFSYSNTINHMRSILTLYLFLPPSLRIKVFFTWCDEALVGRKKDTEVDLTEKGIFDPNLILVNDHDCNVVDTSVKITKPDTGELKMSVHYKGTCFLTNMELHTFPFDCQNLQMVFKPYKLAIEDVVLVPGDQTDCALASQVCLHVYAFFLYICMFVCLLVYILVCGLC